MIFTVFTLIDVLYFREFLIHDSCEFMILKNNRPKLLGLRHFLLNTLSASPYGQTEGQTDTLIRVGLGNLQFLQVKYNGCLYTLFDEFS